MFVSRRATVRHTPLTDTLSPSMRSAAMTVSMATRRPVAVSVSRPVRPTASMRPVNISFDNDVWAERVHPAIEQPARRKRLAVERHTGFPDGGRCDIELDVVSKPRVPDRCMQRRTALDDDALNLARMQRP